MAFIGVRVPASTAAILSKVKVPGDHVPPEEMHVTLLNLGEKIPIPEILQATMACYLMTKRWAPFRASTRRVTTFPKGESDKVPIIARVLCPEMHRLHEALQKSLDHMEIDYSKKFSEFKPHVTLSYSKMDISDVKLIQPVTWSIEEVVIWGGDHGVERIAVTLPLEGGSGIENPLRSSMRV